MFLFIYPSPHNSLAINKKNKNQDASYGKRTTLQTEGTYLFQTSYRFLFIQMIIYLTFVHELINDVLSQITFGRIQQIISPTSFCSKLFKISQTQKQLT